MDIRLVSATHKSPGDLISHLINALEHSAITCKGETIEVQDLPDYIFQREARTGR